MKIFNYHRFAIICCCSLLLMTAVFSACTTTTTTTNNNNNNHLDPVVARNTNSNKDTSKTYNPVINSNNNSNNSNKTPKVDTVVWCDTIQQSEYKRIVVCFEKIGTGKIKADTVAVIDLNPNSLFSVANVDSTIKQKLAYKVVIILPFMSQDFYPAPTKEIPPRSIRAVEFYEGVLMALDSLKNEGVSLFVNVFDTQKDTAAIKELLLKRELEEADMIIGHASTSGIQQIAEFAKTRKKVFISPFNSLPNLSPNNPYYIQVNPAFDIHSEHIVKYLNKIECDPGISRTPLEQNIMILALKEDSARVAAIQKSYSIYSNNPTAKIQEIIRTGTTIDISNVQSYFQKGKMNIVIMPTDNEGFVYNSMREIQKLVDKVEPKNGHQVAIIGLDPWRYYERVSFEYFESMNLYISSEFFADAKSKAVQKFKDDYMAVYGIGAREFGIIGFDVMLYFGRMIQKYGVNFPPHLWKSPAQYRHTKFNIQPRYEILKPLDGTSRGETIIQGFENKFLNFLEYQDYQFYKLN